MKQIIAYIAVFLLTLYCFFLYDEEILTMLLVVEIVYPILVTVWFLYFGKRVVVSMESMIPIAEKGKKIPISIRVKNQKSIFPVHLKAKLQVENLFTGEKKKIQQEKTIKARKTERLTVELLTTKCGNIDITLKECWIYDPLLIFHRRITCKEWQQVGILPESHLIPVEVSRKTREFIADADEYSDKESGEDISEIYQIREYQEQDSLHDIHWKLSAKADNLLVKEHGRPLGSVVLIWLNFKKDNHRKGVVSDQILEAIASLSISLLEEKCVHTVAWYEVENQRIQKKVIRKEEHLYELLCRLLYTKPFEEDLLIQLEETFRGIAFSTVIEFRIDGTVIINKEETRQIPDKWSEFYFVV